MHLIQDTALQFGPGSMPPSPDRHLFNCAPHSSLELDLCTLATDCSSFHCSTVLCGRLALLLLNSPEQERRRHIHPCNALLCRTLSSQSRQLHHGAILRRTECAARLQFAKCNTGNCGTHFFHCCAAVTSRKGAPHLKVLESWQKAAKKET